MAVNFPPVPVYPTEYDTDETLFLVFNSSQTTLSEACSAWGETMEIVPSDDDEWGDNGFATIDGELFYYGGVDRDTEGRIYRFKSCARNIGGTETKFNPAGTEVLGLVVAEHHNQLARAIINTEKFIGYNFDPDEETVDWRVRNLLGQNIIYNDYDCPDVVFNYGIIDDNPVTGTVISYTVTVNGAYGSFQLDFGDGTSTTAMTGFHTYSPNVTIDPVAVVTNNDCEIVQTPIQRDFAEEPKGKGPIQRLRIPVCDFPDFPSIVFPSINFPSLDMRLPPTIQPCIDLSKISFPSFPSFNFPSFPGFNFPSFSFPGVSVGDVNVSFACGGGIEFPSSLDFSGISVQFGGPIPSVVNFGPAPSLSVLFGPAPTIGPVLFGPAPAVSPVDFGPAPTIPVDFGTVPTISFEFAAIPNVSVVFGPAPTIGPVAFGPAPSITVNFGAAPDVGPVLFGPAPTLGPVLFGPAPAVGPIAFGPAPSLVVTFGPAPSIGPIAFGPAPTIGPIAFGPAPTIGPIAFGPAPTISAVISFGTAPTLTVNFGSAPMISVDWGSPPLLSCNIAIQCPSSGGVSMAPMYSALRDTPLNFSEDPQIEMQYDIVGIPSIITMVPPENLPALKIDFTGMPEISFKAPDPIQLAAPLEMPVIRLEMPSDPVISLSVPEFIDLRVPEGLRVPLVFDGPPLSAELKVNWNLDKLGEIDGRQCFTLVPCPRN